MLRVREIKSRDSLRGRPNSLVVALQPATATGIVVMPLPFTDHGFLGGVNYHHQELTLKETLYRWKEDFYCRKTGK